LSELLDQQTKTLEALKELVAITMPEFTAADSITNCQLGWGNTAHAKVELQRAKDYVGLQMKAKQSHIDSGSLEASDVSVDELGI